MRLGVEGLGKMGTDYLAILTRKIGVPPESVIGWDINPERIREAIVKFPGIRAACTFEEFARGADAYIVAVNTPAHHIEIERLARSGARHVLCETGTPSILCEKPLAQNVVSLRKIQAVERRYSHLQISTAMVIAFSPTRTALIELMREHNLQLRRFGGRWGKNRAAAKEVRPTAGDRVDEFIHMTEFGLSLLRSHGIDYIDLVAQVEYLAYVNEGSQRKAHEIDPSFPLRPDSSTHALLWVVLENGMVAPMSLASSYVEAQQVRTVWGNLTQPHSDEPIYAFNIEFDVKGDDVLTITHNRSDTKEVRSLACDKLRALTEAFLQQAQSGVRDDRLASVEWAGKFVEMMEAIGRIGDYRPKGSHWERVHFRPRTWRQRLRG